MLFITMLCFAKQTLVKKMEEKIKLIVSTFGTNRVKLDEPISEHAALAVGGKARVFLFAFTQAELLKIIRVAKQLRIPYFVFGTGSKIMMSDKGFDGVMIKNRTKNVVVVGVKGKVSKLGIGVDEALVEVDSGVSITKLLEFLDHQGLQAQELHDLPGTVGGNLFLNRFLQDRAQSIRIINRHTEIDEIPVAELSLREHIVLSAVFKFKSK